MSTLQSYVDRILREFMDFIDIADFPAYEKREKIEGSFQKGKFWLTVKTVDFYRVNNSEVPILNIHQNAEKWNATHRLFHAFSCMLDAETYWNGDLQHYRDIKGYAEYHAAQIEFLKLLGASSADEELAFSMEDPIRLFDHVLTIREYLQNTFLFIHEYWEDKDMEIGYILRALFAYWGIRSICKLYAEDYKAELDQQNIQNLNGIFSKDAMEVCEYLDKTMYGKALELNREEVTSNYLKLRDDLARTCGCKYSFLI